MTFNNSTGVTYAVASTGGFGIAGTGSLTKGNTGVVSLNTSNSYTGGTTLNAGTLNLGNAAALGTGTFTINGGTFDNTTGALAQLAANNALAWAGDFTFAGSSSLNTGTGAVTVTGVRTVTVAANTLNVGGAVGGTGGIVKAGPGTLALTGATSYSGGTNVSNGTLAAAGNLGAANSAAFVGPAGTVNFSGGTITNAITGTGAVVNSGVVTVTGNNTAFAGTWTANSQFSLNAVTATSAAAAYVDNVANNTNGFILGQAGTYNFGSLSGVAASAVRGGNSGITPGSSIVLSVGGLNTSTTYAGVLADSTTGASGVLSLVKVGTGTLTLATSALAAGLANGYTGGTIVNGGALRVNNTILSGTGSGGVVVNNTATLGGTGTIQNSSGSVTVNAGGTITAGATDAAVGVLTTNGQTWNANGTYVAKLNATATVADELVMSGLTLAATTGTFNVSIPVVGQTGQTSLVLPPGRMVLAYDRETANNPFGTGTLPDALVLVNPNGITDYDGNQPTLGVQADASGIGFDLILVAAPEPTSLLLLGMVAAPLALGRRRRAAR